MLFNRHSMKFSAVDCGAECYGTLQSAVAFWVVLFSFAIGCGPPNPNVANYQIGSSSMSPTWFGPHLTATCIHCGQQSAVVQEAYDPVVTTRCFSCGAVCFCKNDLHAGEVIGITRCTANASLKRFDVVTFDTPSYDDDESPQTLKRVWALPGERIELRDGEAWVDGKQLQKSSQELAAICVPLSRFPKDIRSHWWVVDSSSSESTRIELSANQSHLKLENRQRLEFRYVRPNRNPETPEMLPCQIVNDFPFNQNSIAKFHEVVDFLLAIELVKPAIAPWLVSLQSEGKQYKVRLGSNSESHSRSAYVDGSNRLVIAVCDGRLLASTENLKSQWKLVDLEEILDPVNVVQDSQITITTTETMGIKRLLVARDQWLGPRESRVTEWMPIGTEAEVAGGYFVLGDNLQLSIDSRDATVGRIAPERIAGRVKRLEDSSEWILSLLNHAFRDVDGRRTN